MLNQFLEEILEDFKSASSWYTKGLYTNVYPDELVEELNDICHRVRVLKEKLDRANFKGSFRFTEEDKNR